MADATFRVAPAPTGTDFDGESVTVGGATVLRQRVQIAGATDTAVAGVVATPPVDGAVGLTTRPILSDPGDAAARARFVSTPPTSGMVGMVVRPLLADPSDGTRLARLLAAPPSDGDVGLVTRPILSDPQSSAARPRVYRQPPTEYDYGLVTRQVFPPSMRSSFGALLAQEERCVAALSFAYFIHPRLVRTSESANGGTVTVQDGKALIQTGTASNGIAVLESRDVVRYVPGQAVAVKFTAVFTAGVANSRQVIGVGDASDGFFLGFNGTTLSLLKRNAGVPTWVPRASWLDPLDGTGPSGITIDPTTGNVFVIRYQWLGFGPAEFLFENPTTGELILLYRMPHGNVSASTSIRNPSLPLRAEVANVGSTSNLALQTPSMGAFVVGPVYQGGVRRAAYATKGTIQTEVPVMSLRSRTTFQSLANRVRTLVDFLAVSSTNNQDVRFGFILNPASLTGATYAAFADSNSVIEVDTAASAFTGGDRVHSVPVDQTLSFPQVISSLDFFLRAGEVLTITAQAGGSANVGVDVGWREEF